MNDEEALQMIEDCQNRESKLSSWELEFIQSISERLDDGKPLSITQINKLNDIWEKIT